MGVKDEGGAAELEPTSLDDAITNDGQPADVAAAEGAEGDQPQRRDDLPPEDTSRFDAREAIANKRREKRAEQVADQDEGAMAIRRLANDPDATPDSDEGAAGEGDGSNAAADADDPLMTLTIDGKKVELKRSEVIARAQISTAADERLKQLNAALDEVKKLKEGTGGQTNAAGAKTAQPNADDSRKPAPSTADQPDRKARAAQLVKDIQMGDADDDMADRLLAIVDEARGEGITPDEAKRLAIDAYREEQDDREAEEAFVRVTQANSLLHEERHVREDFFSELVGQAIRELRSVVGMDDDGVRLMMRGTETMSPNQLVRFNHDYFRRQTNPDGTLKYPGLTRPEPLIKGAAERALKEWSRATGTPVAFVDPSRAGKPTASGKAPAVDRSARKARIETHTAPVTASNGAGVNRMQTRAPQPLTREASKRAGFADIKAGRQTGARR